MVTQNVLLSEQGSHRGGVVIWHNMATVTLAHICMYPNTFTTFELSCQNGLHTQTMSVIASYINP